ncbi:unnamed protein product [Prorocentrum cordatum]|uniref:Uncharacterized protein n=1 Tax=Prorocentrum cordatum TaxID=2364126 RepID=A0ABN9PUS6_9DINO|nr:unnamed protein product [Polarella glacialis]
MLVAWPGIRTSLFDVAAPESITNFGALGAADSPMTSTIEVERPAWDPGRAAATECLRCFSCRTCSTPWPLRVPFMFCSAAVVDDSVADQPSDDHLRLSRLAIRLLHTPLPADGPQAAYLFQELDCNVPSVVQAALEVRRQRPGVVLFTVGVDNGRLGLPIASGYGAAPYLLEQLRDAGLDVAEVELADFDHSGQINTLNESEAVRTELGAPRGGGSAGLRRGRLPGGVQQEGGRDRVPPARHPRGRCRPRV